MTERRDYAELETKKSTAAELPTIPKEPIDQFVSGPMRAEVVNAASVAFKKAKGLIERAFQRNLSQNQAPRAPKPEDATNCRNGASCPPVAAARLRTTGRETSGGLDAGVKCHFRCALKPATRSVGSRGRVWQKLAGCVSSQPSPKGVAHGSNAPGNPVAALGEHGDAQQSTRRRHCPPRCDRPISSNQSVPAAVNSFGTSSASLGGSHHRWRLGKRRERTWPKQRRA